MDRSTTRQETTTAILVLVAAWLSGCGGPRPAAVGTLEIEVTASRGGRARLFLDTGTKSSPVQGIEATVRDDGAPQTLRFPVSLPLRRIRFHPFAGPGEMSLRAMRFVPDGGRPIPLPLRIDSIAQIARLVPEAGGVRAVTTRDATTPWLLLATGTLRPSAWWGIDPVRGISVGAVGAVVGLLFLVGTCGAVAVSLAGLGPRDRLVAGCGLGAATCLIVGAKLWLIGRYGSAVPFLDEWADHAMETFLPFSWRELHWQDLFHAHNEHRLFLSRVLALGLVLVDGEWNAITATAAGAALHAWAGVVLVMLLWRLAGHRNLDVIAGAVILAIGLPFGWENTLWAFQSCSYLMLLTLALPLVLLIDTRPGSWRWWTGLMLLALAPLTMGGGVANPGCVLLALSLDHWARKDPGWKRLATSVAAVGGLVVLSIVLLVPTPAHHYALRARSAQEFLTAALSALAWPTVDQPALAVVAWLPLLAVVIGCCVRRRRPNRLEAVLIALAAWVGMQATAIGYSRGGSSLIPASRHQDMLSIGFMVNAAAATVIARSGRGRLLRGATALLAVTWCAWTAVGLVHLLDVQLGLWIRPREAYARAWETSIRRFLQDGDRAGFGRLRFPAELPVGDPALLSELLLADPFLRSRMPSRVRPPLPLVPSRTGPFRTDGLYPGTPRDPLAVSWGSYGQAGNPATGRFESGPIACTRGRLLRFQVAGYLGERGMRLYLEREDGRRTRVKPLDPPGERWAAVYVTCPATRFRIVAIDRRPNRWFAFRAPVESGPLTTLTEIVLDRPWGPIALGILLAWLAARLRPSPRTT